MAADATILGMADLEMDLIKRRVTRAGKDRSAAAGIQAPGISMRNAGQVVTRTMLLENVGTFISIPRPTLSTPISAAFA